MNYIYFGNRIERSPLGNMGLQLLEAQEKLVSQEYEVENLRIKAAMYKAYFFRNSILAEKLQKQSEENRDALIGEFDGFSYASWRANAVYRTLENMCDEGLLTEKEYRECKVWNKSFFCRIRKEMVNDMSYNTWHNYGYGICTDDLKEEINLVKLMKLIQLAPNLYERVKEYIDTYCDGQITETYDILESYVEECGENNYGGLAEIMYEVIKEVEGIELYVCTDFDGAAYLIYPPIYPWQLKNMSDKEKNLTEETLCELYAKYLHVVTDEDLVVEYKSVENGGWFTTNEMRIYSERKYYE